VTGPAALCGWVVAVLAAAVALGARQALDHGREAVARACHELRGPLTAARLGLSLPLGSDDASRARLRAIDGELRRAALALDDLGLARRRAGGGPGLRALGSPGLRAPESPNLRALERVDVGALAAEAVRAAQGRARAGGAELTLAEAPAGLALGRPAPVVTVWGDRLRLGQALGNLIANAIEHGGPEITVRTVTRAWTVRIEVGDSGPGLPAPVAQLARRARGGRGARGRGLAIALAIARSHGGTIASAPARAGARVVLELPVGAGVARGRRVR
jgi:signal transduction histidine kinase